VKLGRLDHAQDRQLIAERFELCRDPAGIASRTIDADADEDVRFRPCSIAVVEFRDHAMTERPDECTETPSLLGNRHRQHDLAHLADFHPFRKLAHPIEIHVGARSDHNQ